MDDLQLVQAAFNKMIRGEALSIGDAQRVWGAVLENGMNVDTGNPDAFGKFVSAVKAQLHERFFKGG